MIPAATFSHRLLRRFLPTRPRRIRHFVRAAPSDESLPRRNYNSSDGRPKTTMEEVFGSKERLGAISVAAPWELGWQMNERNVQWIDSFKEKLIKTFAAEELGVEEEEFEQRLEILRDLLPGFGPRIAQMPPKLIAELVSTTPTLADTLVNLKKIFPEADAGALVVARPSLASRASVDQIKAIGAELRALLPNSRVDLLVERVPLLLDVEQLKECMKLFAMIMPDASFEQMLQRDPDMIFSLQKGPDLIPYDEVPTSPPRQTRSQS